jgi:hypothetical protein
VKDGWLRRYPVKSERWFTSATLKAALRSREAPTSATSEIYIDERQYLREGETKEGRTLGIEI